MPTTYRSPDPDSQIVELLYGTMRDCHPDLARHGVRVGVILAHNADGHPVRLHGYPAAATVKVVPAKDRTTKGYDAELLLDEHFWEQAGPEARAALLDHELSHLRLSKVMVDVDSREQVCARDEHGRPKLKTVPGDWGTSDGFKAVVARHGDHAVELLTLRAAWVAAEAARRGEVG